MANFSTLIVPRNLTGLLPPHLMSISPWNILKPPSLHCSNRSTNTSHTHPPRPSLSSRPLPRHPPCTVPRLPFNLGISSTTTCPCLPNPQLFHPVIKANRLKSNLYIPTTSPQSNPIPQQPGPRQKTPPAKAVTRSPPSLKMTSLASAISYAKSLNKNSTTSNRQTNNIISATTLHKITITNV